MANLTGLVDLNASPESQFAALPSGEYVAAIVDSDLKPTKKGDGKFLALTYQVLEGPYKGRNLWARLNIVNMNPKTQEYAQRDLAKIRHATGHVAQLQDSQELHSIPHLIRVEYKPAQDGYGESNEIKDYKAIAGAAPVRTQPAAQPQQTAPANQADGLPWQRNAA